LSARNEASGEWYLDRLLRERPFLRRPDIARLKEQTGPAWDVTYSIAAFLNANLGLERPLFTGMVPARSVLREDLALVPAGPLQKVVRKGEEKVDPRYWSFALR